MTGDKEVTATFTKEHYVLNIAIIGSGSVIKDPDQETYAYGTSVNLTAVPDTCSKFINWSGDLSGNENPETINMTGDKDVTATFLRDTTPPYTEIILDGTMGDNNWYVSVVTVTLNATDEGSGVESTWYRVDSGYWKF
ncbi:unnamed protein product, partial [marine sediment metagenome]